MSHKYDPLFRLLADAKVVTAQVVRECEALGLTTTTEEVKHVHGVLAKIANNVMTKIESAHVADLMEQAQPERRQPVGRAFNVSDYPPPSSMNPGSVACLGGTRVPSLQEDDMLGHLQASGLQPIVIDENTDFDQLSKQLNLKENSDDSCAAPAEGHSTPAAADPAPPCEAPTPDTPQGEY